MTDKEKKALLNAFGIPEPERKEEFAEEFRQRMSQKEKKRIPPIVMRIAATAAMAAVVIGVYAAMPSSPSELDVTDKIIGTTTTVTYNNESNNEHITSSDKNNTTAPATSVSNTNSTKTTIGDKNIIATNTTAASEHRTNTSTRASVSGRKNNVTTAASRTGKLTSRISSTLTTTNTTHRISTTVKPTTTLIKTTTTTIINNKPVTSPQSEGVLPVTPTNRDMTVTPDVIYTIQGKVVNARSYDASSNAPVADGPGEEIDDAPKGVATNFEQKIREMFNNSYAVVLAKIDKIVYTSINGMPFTSENVSVQEVFKGDLNYNDMITVYVNGGYMPATEYMESHGHIYIDDPENVTVYDNGGCNGKQEEGETYLFFISNDDPDIPYGAFSLSTNGDEAVFRKRRNKYICLSDERMSFNADLLN